MLTVRFNNLTIFLFPYFTETTEFIHRVPYRNRYILAHEYNISNVKIPNSLINHMNIYMDDGSLAFKVLNGKGKRKYIRIVEGNNFTGADRIAILD